MRDRDLHQALKHEVVGRSSSKSIHLVLAKLQWSKEEIGFSLHADPYSHSTYGIQSTDFLGYLAFQRSACPFFPGGECYSRWVDGGFDVSRFGEQFDQAYQQLWDAQRSLEGCGFLLDQPEGWGYYFGRDSSRRRRDFGMGGDGHTGAKVEPMKASEDKTFQFRLSWLENNKHDRGWVVHYRPKRPPLSSELVGVFKYLGLEESDQCPEYEFEPCHWRSFAFHERPGTFEESNAGAVHRAFDAHASHFSAGIEKLLGANAEIEKSGLRFLPLPDPKARNRADIERSVAGSVPKGGIPDTFDVAISFARPERPYAEELAKKVSEAGYSVFYDAFYADDLWGKNLADFFDDIFRKRARFCVIFVSKAYRESMWANHERQSAQARALQEKGNEYILPVKVDDSELTGMPPTIAYLPVTLGIEVIARALIRKVRELGAR